MESVFKTFVLILTLFGLQSLAFAQAPIKVEEGFDYRVLPIAQPIDVKGKVLVKNTYDAAQAVYNGLWPVQQNGKWGLVALDSKIVLPLNYEHIVAFPPFGFLVESNEGVGLLTSANKWLLSPTFKTIKRFETSYFLVENQEGLGVYNTDGSPLIPCAYQRIVRLDDGTFQLNNSSGLSYYLPIENKIVQLQP